MAAATVHQVQPNTGIDIVRRMLLQYIAGWADDLLSSRAMRKIRDYHYDFGAMVREVGQCHIRVYQQDRQPTVFICTEVPQADAISLVTMTEAVAGAIWQHEGRPEPFVWIEHTPSDTLEGSETFHVVRFQIAPQGRFFSPEWQPLTRTDVETLIEEPLE
jgi:hypothetical protein